MNTRYGKWSQQIETMLSQGRRNSAAKIMNRLRSGSLPGWAGGGPIFPKKSTHFAPQDYENGDCPDEDDVVVSGLPPVIPRHRNTEADRELWRQQGNASLGSILSALYAKLLVVMGIAFPMSEVISKYIPPAFYDGFYLYLYFVSILFMSLMFATVIQQRASKGISRGVQSIKSRLNTHKNAPDVVKSEDDMENSDSEASDTLSPLPDETGISLNHNHNHNHSAHNSHHHHQHHRHHQGNGNSNLDNIESVSPIPSKKLSRVESLESFKENGGQRSHFGSFYLRMGAVAFGIGSMIYSGLEFGQYFELENNCHSYMVAITPAVRMIFTFMQMYFIFLNSQMAVSKVSLAKQFGLMHMIGTNLCVWLNVLVQETKHEILHFYNPENRTISLKNKAQDGYGYVYGQSSQNNDDQPDISPTTTMTPFFDNLNLETDAEIVSNGAEVHERVKRGLTSLYECRRANIMGSLVDNASPFLFPCTIEYSLICAAICYVMWKSMAKRRVAKISLKRSNTADSSLAPPSHAGETRSPHHYTVDCAGSNKGLFIGIFVLVFTIMSLILNFVLVKHPEYKALATLEVNITEIILYSTTTLAVLIGMCQMRQLRYETGKNLELDNILLIVAQSGSFVFNVFCIIGGHLTIHIKNSPLVLVTPLICLIQLCLQTLFILDASKRVAATTEQVRKKPGREVVTFLLVCNLAMWLINALEKSRGDSHPNQLKFYGVWGWTIITDISMPLAIFYRFHSTVCLCEIWKKAYKVKH